METHLFHEMSDYKLLHRRFGNKLTLIVINDYIIETYTLEIYTKTVMLTCLVGADHSDGDTHTEKI